MPLRVLETDSFPHAVPINGHWRRAEAMLATRWSRARGRGRDPEESGGLSRMWLEREGASNQGDALPGVRVHDASCAIALGEADLGIFHGASRSDSTVVWLELGDRLTPSPPSYALTKRSRSKARLRFSMK